MSGEELEKDLYLIGEVKKRISGQKLPTCKQVLSVFYYQHRNLGKTIRMSANVVTEEVLEFWTKAGILTKEKYHIIDKIESLYDNWLKIKKNKSRKSEAQQKRENEFLNVLSSLFDVAHENALNDAKLPEVKDFLIQQRSKNHAGRICNVAKLVELEKQKLLAKKQVYFLDEIDSISDDSLGNTDDENDETFVLEEKAKKTQRKIRKKNLFANKELVASLDSRKITDRDATFVLTSMLKSANLNPDDYATSRSTARRTRIATREKIADDIKSNFKPNGPLVVHWDGKLMKNTAENTKVDKLPIVVSGEFGDKLLDIPELKESTGHNQALAVLQALEEWNLSKEVRAMCFDTTATNTGN